MTPDHETAGSNNQKQVICTRDATRMKRELSTFDQAGHAFGTQTAVMVVDVWGNMIAADG